MPDRSQFTAAMERHQVWIYLGAALAGLACGQVMPFIGAFSASAVWAALVLLMYGTFTQISSSALRSAWSDWRFLTAALVGNFVVVPLVLGALLPWLPENPAVRLGIIITLLAPCTDWFITFTHLGKGDASRAASLAPLSLILQIPTVPLYWALLSPAGSGPAWGPTEILPAVGVIVVPLAIAWLTEAWLRSRDAHSNDPEDPRSDGTAESRWRSWWSRIPVPALGAVIFLVMAGHVNDVAGAVDVIPSAGAVYVGYLAIALVIAKGLSLVFRLSPRGSRTLAFSLGTRNSFVVLPLALALPAGWELSGVVVVLQSLVELLGMILYLWIVPKLLFRDRPV
ncbi:arsenic resistance protein [uncultured Kocuria sp.]|uniref:arsenic resistance protein n=1 Tax=uncultured Kocuria sp. TaxID=259305 RepID=UPI00259226C2|nr:bile acid:sodium symporter [uncultured Kocuria sp.]